MESKDIQLSTIFTISIFLVALIVGVTCVFYSFTATRLILEEKVNDNLRQLANAHAHHIETFLEDKKNKVLDFGFDKFIVEKMNNLSNKEGLGLDKELNEYLVKYRESRGLEFYEIFVLNQKGQLVATTNIYDDMKTDFFKDILFREGERSVYMSDFIFDKEKFREEMIISAPITDNNKFLGVVAFRLSIQSLFDLINEIITANKIGSEDVEKSEDVYLMNTDGLFIVSPARFEGRKDTGILSSEVDRLDTSPKFCLGDIFEGSRRMTYEGSASFTDLYGNEYITTHTTIPATDWCLMVEVNKSDVLDKPLFRYIINQLIVLTIVMVIINFIGLFYRE
ncbi:cache domain-containing protein [Patescibacteria group bacterium]|nr:cache domain-containing protein [Patescibacteria group bacterium]